MGIAASLFFSSNDTAKQTLHRRITPTDAQFEEQQGRWNELADHLIADLRVTSGCAISSWLQGSYKFGTQIRPPSTDEEFDIDLGIYFQWAGAPEDGDYDAANLRSMVQSSLVTYAATANSVTSVMKPPKPRCSRIHYDGDFHIDVPSYHLDPDADVRFLASATGWEDSDPKDLYVWWKEQVPEARRDKARRYVKYLKCWAGLKFEIGNGRPSSVMLTVLVAEAISGLADADIASDDDGLRSILGEIAYRLADDLTVKNPVNPTEDLNRLTDPQKQVFVKGIHEFLEIADDACGSNSDIEAADTWSKAFLHFFPLPEIVVAQDQVMAKASGLPVAFAFPDVEVSARNGFAPGYRALNRIGPIPKNYNIKFSIVEPWKLPQGTTVEWMVRNTGDEAETVNDLGHRRTKAGFEAEERSAYVGTHYMDCILRRGGRIVGMRRVPVIITGATTLLRRPPQPAYVRLRGRK
jgi:hypothetical protein